jgi:hypothetical protein
MLLKLVLPSWGPALIGGGGSALVPPGVTPAVMLAVIEYLIDVPSFDNAPEVGTRGSGLVCVVVPCQ